MPKLVVYIPLNQLEHYISLMNEPCDYQGPPIKYSLVPKHIMDIINPSEQEISLILTLEEYNILENQ